jgi:hypothetical protein
MQLLTVLSVAMAMGSGAVAKEMAKNEKLGAELYDTGIMMDRIMMTKKVRRYMAPNICVLSFRSLC